VFSVDAGTKETYERIRVKGNFERVVENIERFNDIRKNEFPKSVTVTRISGVKVDNEQDIEQMSRFWSTRVDEVSIKPALPRWDSYNNPKVDTKHACNQLWDRIYVWYDGTLNPCDFDYKSLLKVGNILDMTIKDAWHGEVYSKLREDHLNFRRGCHIPCDRCPI
jgi:MoaA/NifB/PqqE/SkfB family radical SAM enzyme